MGPVLERLVKEGSCDEAYSTVLIEQAKQREELSRFSEHSAKALRLAHTWVMVVQNAGC